jgi:hypothetical protein
MRDAVDTDFTRCESTGVLMKFRPVLFHCCLILAEILLFVACRLCRRKGIPVPGEAMQVPAESS